MAASAYRLAALEQLRAMSGTQVRGSAVLRARLMQARLRAALPLALRVCHIFRV